MVKTLEQCKALDNILTDELNVHQLCRHMGKCEKGEITLIYHNNLGFGNRPMHDVYTWTVGNECCIPASDKVVEAVLG